MIWLCLYLLVAFILLLPAFLWFEIPIPDEDDRIIFAYIGAAAWPITLLAIGIAIGYCLYKEARN